MKKLALVIAMMFSSSVLADRAFETVKTRNNQQEIATANEVDMSTSLKGLYTLHCGEQQSSVLVQKNKFAITGNSVHDIYVLEVGKSGQTQSGYLSVQFGDSAKSTVVTLNTMKCEFKRGGSERASELLGLEIEKAVKIDTVQKMYSDKRPARNESLKCNKPAYAFEIINDFSGITLRQETRRTVMKEVPIEERTELGGVYAPRKSIEKSIKNFAITAELSPGLNEITLPKQGIRIELTQDLQRGSLLVEIPEKGVICRPFLMALELERLKELEQTIKDAHKEIEK